MSRNESQKYKALPKGYSRLCVLSGQTENEEGSVEMVIGSDVDTMKMKTSSVKMSTQYEESPTNFRHKLQKNFQGMSKKNNASNIGGYSLDGCGEFLPAGDEGTIYFFKGVACECHKNFHRILPATTLVMPSSNRIHVSREDLE